jgi:hypothetical protein
MGAYRHSPLREFVMGGATYAVLGRPPCWVLMSQDAMLPLRAAIRPHAFCQA